MATKLELLQSASQHFSARQFGATVELARALLEIAPDHPQGIRMLGASLRQLGRLDESVEVFRRGVAAYPRDAVLLAELGTALVQLNEHEEAFSLLLESVRIEPKLQSAFLNLGAILQDQCQYEDSMRFMREAIRLKPTCGLSHYNLANSLRELGRFDEALESFQAAARIQPDLTRATYNLGLLHLLLGEYALGWPGYEYREAVGEVIFDKYPQPRWDGSPLDGKSLVIHGEQGVGDEVLFASCVPELIAQAKRLTLICEPRLATLFARSFPAVHVQGFARLQNQGPAPLSEPHDWQIPAGSLPLFLRPNRESFPRREQFLTVDPAARQAWRHRLDLLGPGMKIGISWRAGGKAIERRKRSQTLDDWRDILAVPGVHFINLQYSDTIAEREEIRRELGVTIHDWEDADPLVDLDGFAAKLAALDLVISVGNATVHLAGAVGTPTWSILPLVPSWRWLAHGEENPWYASVRLFRQREIDVWDPVFREIGALLRDLAARGANASSLAARPWAAESSSARKPTLAGPVAVSEPLNLNAVTAPARWLSRTDMLGHSVEDHIHHLLDRAAEFQRRKDYAAAESLLREALLAAPKHARVLNNLGLVAWKTGRLDLAIQCFRRALVGVGKTFDFRYNLAAVLALSGRFDEAAIQYREVVKLAPKFRAGQLELGLALQRAGKNELALAPFRAAQALDPNDFDAFLHEGRSLARLGRIDEARRSFLKAAELEPICGPVWLELGQNFALDRDYRLAEPCLQRAVALEPSNPEGLQALAGLLEQTDRGDGARKLYHVALTGDRPNPKLLLHAASFERRRGHGAEAVELLARAAAIEPNNPEIENAWGEALAEQNRLAEARQCYERVLAAEPRHAVARVNRALVAMASGNLDQAWTDYEYRLQLPGARPRLKDVDIPIWDGGSLSGQTILVRAEQGLSEQLMFATCLPELIAQAGRTVIECDVRLATLFERAFPQAGIRRLVPAQEHLCQPLSKDIDWQISLGSLPRIFRRRVGDFASSQTSLSAESSRRSRAARRLAALPPGLRIGLHLDAASMNRPQHQDVAYATEILCGAGDAQFLQLELQTPPNSRAAAPQFRAAPNVHHLTTGETQTDFEELAAALAALDLLICVDSPLLHLAGSLRTPTLALCPNAPLGCTWLAGAGGHSLWYPSVEILRSQRLGDMGDLARQAREKLSSSPARAADAPLMKALVGPHWPTAATASSFASGR